MCRQRLLLICKEKQGEGQEGHRPVPFLSDDFICH